MAKEGSGLAAPDWNARRSSVNAGAPWPAPKMAEERVLGIQRKLHKWAQDDQDRRFNDLHNLVCDPATLQVAWRRVRANRGSRSAGVDGRSAAYVEKVLGVERFLAELREELRSGSYRPLPVRERMIPKRGGKRRRLGIATVRDRVVQAALKLVLEPIFEVDFEPCSYGFRPGRRAQDAIAEVHFFTTRSYEWIVEADIEACFDRLSHVAILDGVRARIVDRRILRLVKAFLKAGIMSEHGGLETQLTGTPQGGILSPLMSNVALSALDEHFARAWEVMGDTTERKKRRRQGKANYRLVRYADDCVPRTLKEDRCRRRFRRMRCCTRDEGAGPMVWWPFAVALQGEAANHREVRRSRAGVLSVAEKACCQRVRCGSRRRAQAIPLMKCRKRMDGIKTGVESLLRDEPGGSLLIGQVVPGTKVARAWSGLLCGTREPVAPRPRTSSGARSGLRSFVEARTPSSRNCEGESSDAGHRGGPDRSSCEGSVMGLERRGRVVLAGLAVNRLRVEGAG
jgi:group II intron reverse transcriptase/maturase